MIELLIARADRVDATGFALLRAAVPAARRRKSDRYHREQDRYASVVSFSLLQHLWRSRTDAPMPPLVLGRRGKPRFDGPPRWHFNWSHDAGVCVCAAAPAPVGVDVQSRVPFDEGLFARMTAPAERHLRTELRDGDDMSALWTRKEAVVKRTGWGLSTPLWHVDTLAAGDILTLTSDAMDVRISLTVAGLSEQETANALRVRFLRPGREPGRWREARDHERLRRLRAPTPGRVLSA